jgi:hypothetical protein
MQVLFIAIYSSFQIQPMAINPYVCLTHQFVIQTLTQPIHIPNQMVCMYMLFVIRIVFLKIRMVDIHQFIPVFNCIFQLIII